ncbi:MAG: ATP-binding protein [Candidatus Thiodiazotropha sp. (ex Dulcina madagascariensis)]|nr:ATP-binding protein [Candidatus Thiodiazotropha sp. (ex Dulcina madagascariensis)]
MSEIISDIEEDRKLSSTNETDTLLSGLIQEDQYVGDVYSMSYDSALVQIHDRYRMDAGGVPGLCFLIATRKKKNDNLAANDEDASVILLRVLDSSPLPNASEAERLRVEAAQRIAGEGRHWDEPGVMDAYTANLLGFAGLRCRIIGTFYAEQAPNSDRLRLRFGSDISNYYSNHALSVYKPNTSALGQIVNYRDLDSIKDHPLGQFCVVVGSVRYASTNRQEQGVNDVRINIAPADLLNMKTALFGMTRTGKSNTTKIIAKSVFELRYKDETNGRIGQIIFDYNGEYANENIQDKGALKRIWEFNDDGNEADVVTYGTEPHRNDANRRLLKLNFYADEMLPLGKQIIDDELSDDKAEFVRNFRNVSFEEVPENLFSSEGTRYRRCLLAYRALLSRSSFPLPENMTIPKGKNLFNPSLTKAMAPDYSVNWWKARGMRPKEKDPISILEKKIEWRYRYGVPNFESKLNVLKGDSASMLYKVQKLAPFKLLLTSPPYYNVTNYNYDQWIRRWMLDGPPNPINSAGRWENRFHGMEDYRYLLKSVFSKAAKYMVRDSRIVVRTDARQFTFDTTLDVLKTVFPDKSVEIIDRPYKGKTQTALFGDKSEKPGEKDIIMC